MIEVREDVCIACGSRAWHYWPFCERCAAFYVWEVGAIETCSLCYLGLRLDRGLHLTQTGGHAGRCTRNAV